MTVLLIFIFVHESTDIFSLVKTHIVTVYVYVYFVFAKDIYQLKQNILD